MAAGTIRAQCPLRVDSIYGRTVDSIRQDIDSMYSQMDKMNNFFYPMIQLFDSVKGEYNDTVINGRLDALIQHSDPSIKTLKDSLDIRYIRRDSHWKPDTPRQDYTCFYYKTHKEVEDFKNSVELLERSMRHLVINHLISTIAAVRFLNSYYYMSTCRSLLLARMNNLENETVLFRPYIPYTGTVTKFGVIKFPTDRSPDPNAYQSQTEIGSAIDESIKETRKGSSNWFLKSAAGGVTGALIVYLLASLIRGHK